MLYHTIARYLRVTVNEHGYHEPFLINLLLADIDLRKLYVALAAAAVAHIF